MTQRRGDRSRGKVPAEDVLGRIDAAVDSRCACGCGAALHEGGPSAWFATPACQHRFYSRTATDAASVYRRDGGYDWGDDAAAGYEATPGQAATARAGYEATPGQAATARAAAWLQRVIAQVDEHVAAEAAARRDAEHGIDVDEIVRHAVVVPGYRRFLFPVREVRPPADLLAALPYQPRRVDVVRRYREAGWMTARPPRSPLRWLRFCRRCGADTEPQDLGIYVTTVDRVVDFAAPPDFDDRLVTDYRLVNACSVCGQPWDGPHMSALARRDEEIGAYHALLTAGDRVCASTISAQLVEFSADVGDRVVACLWADLERQLVNGLYYREPCQQRGCQELARLTFEVPFRIDPTVQLCQAHGYQLISDLMRQAPEAFGPPAVQL